jgi:alkylhydroperoxidase family enzyme
MARLKLPDGDGSERTRLWQLRPEIGAAADQLATAIYQSTTLPLRVREAVRYRIARINDCPI